jgi:hypothetical protein
MDPLHPIVAIPPNIPPVTPAPTAGRVDRDGARTGADQERRRRRRPPGGGGENSAASYDGFDYPLDDADDEDDSGLHVNVTA